jgi:DNA-directed RNA polymerase subunit M/transcription elongation factor TFIIS
MPNFAATDEPLTVEIRVNIESARRNPQVQVTCPACGHHFEILVEGRKREKKVNARYCPDCHSNLIIHDEDGNELNEPWATLDTTLSRVIGEMFHAESFPDRVTAQKWHALEKEVVPATLHKIALAQKERYHGLGRSIWAQLLQSASKGAEEVAPDWSISARPAPEFEELPIGPIKKF